MFLLQANEPNSGLSLIVSYWFGTSAGGIPCDRAAGQHEGHANRRIAKPRLQQYPHELSLYHEPLSLRCADRHRDSFSIEIPVRKPTGYYPSCGCFHQVTRSAIVPANRLRSHRPIPETGTASEPAFPSVCCHSAHFDQPGGQTGREL